MSAVLTALLFLLAVNQVQAEWGRNATFAPGWERLAGSAKDALLHPMTWAPAISGLIVNSSGRDDVWTESLYEKTPVFGSPMQANEAADDYRTAADALWVISVLITDSGEQPLQNKAKGTLVQWGAITATRAASNALKAATDREEPGWTGGDAEGDAFPSNHTTGAFAHAALVRENMKQTRLSKPLATAYTTTAYLAATASSLGRIEAGGHHVSDQLFGAALGNFMATFINEAFMGGEGNLSVVSAGRDAIALSWRLEF